MPELPEDDPRIGEYMKNLKNIMQLFLGKPLTSNTLYEIQNIIQDTRTVFKREYGYDIPKLTALVLPTSGFIGFYRADLDNKTIQTQVLNLLREFAVYKTPVLELELASAIKTAWPNYDPAIEVFRTDGQAKDAFKH